MLLRRALLQFVPLTIRFIPLRPQLDFLFLPFSLEKKSCFVCLRPSELHLFNPIKAGGSESFLKKALEIRYRVKMHVHAQFFKASSLKKKLDR